MKTKYIGELINRYIPDVILDAYYGLTPQPRDRKSISTAYVGRLHRHNNPFQYCIEGGYPLTHYYELVRYQIKDGYFERTFGVSPLDISDAFKVWGKNFQEGFESFETDIVKAKSALFSERSDHVRTIFEYATGRFFSPGGFPETRGTNAHVFSAWGEAGKEMGYFYRAWYLMLENHSSFIDLFTPQIKKTNEEFVTFLVRGVYSLQKQDVNAECIRNQKQNSPCRNESEFRNWFIPWMEAKYATVSAEILKGTGRIDLKVEDPTIGVKIVEFKGWWNNDKRELINQLTQYLTEFEGEGYIFMINHLKQKNIVQSYKEIVTNAKTKCSSWKEIPYSASSFFYYASTHDYGRGKTIYHIIYNIYQT